MKKLLAAVLMSAPFMVSAVELVTNGSFEDPGVSNGNWHVFTGTQVPGWTAVPQIEVRNSVVGTASDGNNFVELDANSNSSIWQDIATSAGSLYTLTFDFSNRSNTAVRTNGLSFSVGAGAVALPSLAYNGTSGNVWNSFSYAFSATSAVTRLTFSALGNNDSYGSSLDNVSVTAVPEPQTYALMLAGLGLVGFIARRRRPV